MEKEIAKYKLKDLEIGQVFSFIMKIEEKDVNSFANLSGDFNPLHMSEAFALERGFLGRLVHGFLLSSYLSRLIGVHLPGENCILQTADLKFVSPVYINDTIEITGIISFISVAMKAAVIEVSIKNKKNFLVKGKIQIGFSESEKK